MGGFGAILKYEFLGRLIDFKANFNELHSVKCRFIDEIFRVLN